MNETAATIKELSAELHVSEQALRQWCKRNEIQKTTKGKVTSYFLSANDVELIRKHYTEQRKQPHNESESKAQRKESEYLSLLAENEKLKAHITEQNNKIESLRQQQRSISALRDQVESRERIITELKAEKDGAKAELRETKKELDELRAHNIELEKTAAKFEEKEKQISDLKEQIAYLQERLAAEQALHAGTIQKTAIELKEPAEQAQSEPPEKRSLFARIFKRHK